MNLRHFLSQSTPYKYELLKIVSYVLDISIEKLYSLDLEIDNDKIKIIQQLFKKYAEEKIPLEYLVGEVDFFWNKFFVNEDVLIPRPETEYLVQYAIEEIKSKLLTINSKFSIYDIWTGSWVIWITICKNLNIPVICSDISEKALEIAKKNAKNLWCGRISMMSDDSDDCQDSNSRWYLENKKFISLKVNSIYYEKFKMIRRYQDDNFKKNIKFVKSNLAEHIKDDNFKIICANLPYVPENFKIDDYAKKEPELALFAGNEGLALYEKLLEQVSNAILFLELTKKQAEKLVEEFSLKQYKILDTCHENIKVLKIKV